jgi:hypothetical protein
MGNQEEKNEETFEKHMVLEFDHPEWEYASSSTWPFKWPLASAIYFDWTRSDSIPNDY